MVTDDVEERELNISQRETRIRKRKLNLGSSVRTLAGDVFLRK